MTMINLMCNTRELFSRRYHRTREMQGIKTIIGFVALVVGIVEAQDSNSYSEKPGSCPPAQPVQICSRSCYVDGHCRGVGKCCPTSCGGSVCTVPVTMTRPATVKPGSCPETPTGRWVCSPTCSTDSDCRGTKKCCRNRCGALACQKPDVEIVESVEIPYQPVPNNIPDSSNSVNLNPNNPFLFSSN